MNLPRIVSHEEWTAARQALLVREQEVSRACAAVNEQRRLLPMTRIEMDYIFTGPDGKLRLADLFDGRRQLLIYHFMFDPSWDQGCLYCSLAADNFGHPAHLNARDTTLAAISRAPITNPSLL